MNVENEWGDNIATSKAVDAVNRVDVKEVQCAIHNMKNCKRSGPSEVFLKKLKAGVVSCLNYLIAIFTMSSLRVSCQQNGC